MAVMMVRVVCMMIVMRVVAVSSSIMRSISGPPVFKESHQQQNGQQQKD